MEAATLTPQRVVNYDYPRVDTCSEHYAYDNVILTWLTVGQSPVEFTVTKMRRRVLNSLQKCPITDLTLLVDEQKELLDFLRLSGSRIHQNLLIIRCEQVVLKQERKEKSDVNKSFTVTCF